MAIQSPAFATKCEVLALSKKNNKAKVLRKFSSQELSNHHQACNEAQRKCIRFVDKIRKRHPYGRITCQESQSSKDNIRK